MRADKTARKDFRQIARQTGIEYSKVENALRAYFGEIIWTARKLPFCGRTKIFTSDGFDKYRFVRNIPYIGRIGPIYGRYLKWRAKENSENETVNRKKAKEHYSSPIIEQAMKDILDGKKPDIESLKGRIPKGVYRKVWICSENGKKSARQMIVNNKKIKTQKYV